MNTINHTNTESNTEQTNLFAMLWEASEEGEVYECTAEQIEQFISLRIDNGEFVGFATPTDVEVPDSEAKGYEEAFAQWLKQ